MEIGEPAIVVSGTKLQPPPVLSAEVISVSFSDTLPVSRNKSTVSGSHWELSQRSNLVDDWPDAKLLQLPLSPYSKRPAVLLIKGASGANHALEVRVRVTKSRNVGTSAVLSGSLGGLHIEGSCPTAVGEHKVQAQIQNPPLAIAGSRGQMTWSLRVHEGPTVHLNSTLLEVYFVLAPPTPLYQSGIWVEVLRVLCGRAGLEGKKTPSEVATAICRYCHGSHQMKYDTMHGAPAYIDGELANPIFLLTMYLKKRFPRVNCYDQACAIQTLCAAVGTTVQWIYLRPFGFINATNLVGIGPCNNPFFDSNNSPPLVARDDPRRTAFGNHAFCQLMGHILDACAGPHTGNETAAEYVVSAIDSAATLYTKLGIGPGTASQMIALGGVSGLD